MPKNTQGRLQNIFPTPIWWVDLDLNNDALADECYQVKNSQPEGEHCGTRDGYQSNDLDLNTSQTNLLQLIEEITELSNTIFQSEYLEKGDRRELYVDNCWVNINSKGGCHLRHTHPGAFFLEFIMLSVCVITIRDLYDFGDRSGKILLH